MRVKVCGITRNEDALRALELGADFLGLNFWPGSSRFVTRGRAREIAEAVAGRVQLVGVFVDASEAEILRTIEDIDLDLVQLHGQEGPEWVESLPLPVIKAFRVGADFEPAWLKAWPTAWGFLFDRHHDSAPGGTGLAWDWGRVAGLCSSHRGFLAGGLRPDNVALALGQAPAWAVDVCSGVESAPGIKDPDSMNRFFAEVRDAKVLSTA